MGQLRPEAQLRVPPEQTLSPAPPCLCCGLAGLLMLSSVFYPPCGALSEWLRVGPRATESQGRSWHGMCVAYVVVTRSGAGSASVLRSRQLVGSELRTSRSYGESRHPAAGCSGLTRDFERVQISIRVGRRHHASSGLRDAGAAGPRVY